MRRFALLAGLGAIALARPGPSAADVPQVSLAGADAILLVIGDAAADSAGVAAGTAVAVATILAATDWRDAVNDLDRAFAAAGVVAIATTSTTDQEIRTIQIAGGARATLVVRAGGGSITVTPRPTKARPPGKCVAIPEVSLVIHRHDRGSRVLRRHLSGMDQDGELHARDQDLGLSTTRLIDVDGDAVLDAVVPAVGANGCPQDATWDIYVVRGTCGHHVGTVGPGHVVVAGSRHHGFADLATWSESSGHGKTDPVPVLTRTGTMYAMARGRYRKGKTETTSARCHHCSTWWCNR